MREILVLGKAEMLLKLAKQRLLYCDDYTLNNQINELLEEIEEVVSNG
ncbi:hypothetical protein [Bacillus cereus]|nr:hypothetical protein [Bacillus cereus]